MLRKRLKPGLLLEAAFILLEAAVILIAWLVAWLVFDAKLYVIIIVIFTAYGLVFLYENWSRGRDWREQVELRRSKREEDKYVRPDRSQHPLRRSNAAAGEAKQVETATSVGPALSTAPISERTAAERQESEGESEADLPLEVIAARAASAREQAEREARERQAALKPPEPEPEPQPEPGEAKREEPEPVPGAVAGADALAVQVPETPAQPEPPRERVSLLAEFAAHSGEGRRTHVVGGWNVWQLERMMAARTTREEERDNERSLLLIYLREFADSDGQLPPEFDELVHESFGDLVRGPAGP